LQLDETKAQGLEKPGELRIYTGCGGVGGHSIYMFFKGVGKNNREYGVSPHHHAFHGKK
jgi:hypothetical protein